MVSTARGRPSTPAGRSSPPPNGEHGSPSDNQEGGAPQLPPMPMPAPPRRSSFSFLRRSKSGEMMSRRSASGAKIKKRQPSQHDQGSDQSQQELLRQQQQQPQGQPQEVTTSHVGPPALPAFEPPPPLRTFGGDQISSSSLSSSPGGPKSRYMANYSGPATAPPSVPIPPIPDAIATRLRQGEGGPEGRAGSITHRGRYSYASSMVSTANNPRRVRRRKDPTAFKSVVYYLTLSLSFIHVHDSISLMGKNQIKCIGDWGQEFGQDFLSQLLATVLGSWTQEATWWPHDGSW